MPNEAGTTVTEAELEKLEADITERISKGLAPELQKTLGDGVVPWLHKLAENASEDTRKSILEAATLLNLAAKGKMPPQFMKPNSDETAMAEGADKGKSKDGKTGACAPKQKALSLDDADTDSVGLLKIDSDGNLHIVTKGAKKLTAERTSALSEAATKILGLLKETDEAAFKAAIEAIGKELPSTATVPQAVKPTGIGSVDTPKPTTKNDSDPRDAQIEALTKRLDAIEKARTPTTSVGSDGGTDGAKPVEKSFWSGILS